MVSRRSKLGAVGGLAVYIILIPPVYLMQSGTLGGTALGLLVLSPLPMFIGGGVAGTRTLPLHSNNLRTATKEGVIAGALISILPALIAARFGYGLAASGDNLFGAGGIIVTGIIGGIILIGGLFGGLGGGIITALYRRIRAA